MDYAAKDNGADIIATGHNLDDTLQTFLINMLSGDTTKIGWMDPDTSAKNSIKKIKAALRDIRVRDCVLCIHKRHTVPVRAMPPHE